MSDASNPGPRYGIATTLRGYKDFEKVYQGQLLSYCIPLVGPTSRSGRDPISDQAFTQLVGEASSKHTTSNLVNNATGMDPWLIGAQPCHPGTSLLLHLPMLSVAAVKGEQVVSVPAQYSILWRLRGADVLVNDRQYHAFMQDGRSSTSPVDAGGGTGGVTFAGPATRRTVIGAAVETFNYPQAYGDVTDPIVPTNGTRVLMEAVQYTCSTPIGISLTALLPNLVSTDPPVQGVFQQGILPSSVLNQPVNFHAVETSCKGDEYLVVLSFNPALYDPDSTYDFTTTSRLVSAFFGQDLGGTPAVPNPGLGVQALVGYRG